MVPIVYDDLTHHARAYRELSLLLRRPPGREAFPGRHLLHSLALARTRHVSAPGVWRWFLDGAAHCRNRGTGHFGLYSHQSDSSITDGQIYLSPILFQKALLPAVDVGNRSLCVGQSPVAGLLWWRATCAWLMLNLKSLEVFARFSTRLDEKTRHTLARGGACAKESQTTTVYPPARPRTDCRVAGCDPGRL